MITNCAKPFSLHDFTSLLKGAQFPVARSPLRPVLFFTVASYFGGSSVWNFFHVALLASGILRWLMNCFGTFVHPWAVTISYLSLYLLCPLY
jgi:hypothetical protein